MSGPRSRAAILALGDLLAAEHGESCDCETCLAIQPLVDNAARAAALAMGDAIVPPPAPVAGLREAGPLTADEYETIENGTSSEVRGLVERIAYERDAALSGMQQLERAAALLAEPVPLPNHPDDGHPHSWGCRRCGVDPAEPVPLDVERLLGSLGEDDLMYDHPISMGEPMDPVLFVRWDAIAALLAEPASTERDGR